MEANSYKLHIGCPECENREGMRLHVDEAGQTMILCVECKEGDVVDEDTIASILSGITKKLEEEAKNSPEVENVLEWLEGFIHERMES